MGEGKVGDGGVQSCGDNIKGIQGQHQKSTGNNARQNVHSKPFLLLLNSSSCHSVHCFL